MLIRQPVPGEKPPPGFIAMNLPGTRPAWVDRDLGDKLVKLVQDGRLMEARTLLLWFGGETVDE